MGVFKVVLIFNLKWRSALSTSRDLNKPLVPQGALNVLIGSCVIYF